MRNQKGITLIALVITIIVLLILAGISIAMLTGENGILTNAQNSKSQTVYSEARERMQLAYMAVRTEIAAQKAADSDYDTADDLDDLEQIVTEDLGDDYIVEVVGTNVIRMTYKDSAIDAGSISAEVKDDTSTEGVDESKAAVPAYDGYVNAEIKLEQQTASFEFDTATQAQ